MGVVIGLVGLLLMIGCGIWLLVEGFREHIGWGIAMLLIPFASLVFVVLNWEVGGKPFLGHIVGFGLMMLGGSLAGAS